MCLLKKHELFFNYEYCFLFIFKITLRCGNMYLFQFYSIYLLLVKSMLGIFFFHIKLLYLLFLLVVLIRCLFEMWKITCFVLVFYFLGIFSSYLSTVTFVVVVTIGIDDFFPSSLMHIQYTFTFLNVNTRTVRFAQSYGIHFTTAKPGKRRKDSN